MVGATMDEAPVGMGVMRDTPCFCCGETGRYASACPDSLEDAQRCLAMAKSTTTGNETETADQLLMAGTMYEEQEDEDTKMRILPTNFSFQ